MAGIEPGLPAQQASAQSQIPFPIGTNETYSISGPDNDLIWSK